MELRYNIEDIDTVVSQVINEFETRTILLIGDMGVGKTTLVKALVSALGSTDRVSSPTFSIVNEYELTRGLLYHFDMYRIIDEEEALQLGFEDYLSSSEWVVIEWPEKIPNLLPETVDVIELTLNNDHSRTLKLNENINSTKKYGKKLQQS